MAEEQALTEVFRRNIQRLLEEKEKKQRELADSLELSEASVSNWLKGNRTPRLDRVEAIADFFHVEPLELFGVRSAASTSSALPTSPDQRSVRDDLSSMLEGARSRQGDAAEDFRVSVRHAIRAAEDMRYEQYDPDAAKKGEGEDAQMGVS